MGLAFVIFLLVIAVYVQWYRSVVELDRKVESYREDDKRFDREMSELSAVASDIETAAQTMVVAELLAGKKCKACTNVFPASEVEPVETTSGKAVELCGGCRSLIDRDGMEKLRQDLEDPALSQGDL